MSIQLIQERLNAYNCASQQEEENALREITQELALAALSRSDFFKKAAFQGGTCLRIFHSLERFSEDLDFMLRIPDQNFSFTPYIKNMASEFESYGYNLEVIDRSKAEDIVKKCFFKQDSLGQVLSLTHLKFKTTKIRIKLEVDTNPPKNSGFVNRFLDFPFPFSVTMQDMPSLFSGKSHALLCREYTKSRDWYDFIWYISHKIKMNWDFLSSALNQQGPWKGLKLKVERNWYTGEIAKRIERIDWNTSKQEMLRFLKPTAIPGLDVWSKEFFLDCLSRLAND